MRKLLTISIFFLANVGFGNDLRAKTPRAYHPTIEVNRQPTNLDSREISNERSYIDTTDDEQRALPKFKPKRHIFAKTVLGLAGAFVVGVFIFIIITGGFEFKY
jgi:hypothetical protein